MYWNLATLGKTKVYVVYDNEKIIHTSYVIRGREKFLFLNKGDIEIGPCWTHHDYRGRGIYPTVLERIISNEIEASGKAYMIIDHNNTASQHGVAKVGFTKTNSLVERNVFRQHFAVTK